MTSKTGFESRFASNRNVKLHYVAAGSGPPLLFLHGFPDYSLGWRRQIEALCGSFRVLAPDLRGFGRSDAPRGHAQYTLLPHLVEDVLSVLVAEQLSQASIVGHDWGATIAWWLAMRVPQVIRHLVVLSTPHPRNYLRAIADPTNARFFAYMRLFQEAGASAMPAPEKLAEWVDDEVDRQALAESLRLSDPEAMLGYYRANIPLGRVPDIGQLPLVKAPTLVMFGAHDPYVPTNAYDGTFREVDNVTSLIAIPGAGHFIHHQAAGLVSREIEAWVSRPPSSFRSLG
ncbi:alpha/beta hydrolase [Mesorhizobium sp. CA18]|uniref:alpha/beta fold hydrolase n=1 Tax=unclassified Mesorhizobium TaxID=325217 RepID=UPI001CCF6482|nr:MULTISPECIES: alpha/beta hydrolase [unclassified Mesorhizobium]MBZ9734850.1 alpha/beta hydrolase [Mesorhizobium sp. CA9]MBZ9827149.1 alpha/beta hydrolase [Mesorhizobium sp. CA18]MBZ9838661.1 alpha/beta hydrolase [Mesorhizobium sp. CA3]MBZ9879269.1 alpha/beta hydrolase [Mesorhizobium sp. Ca11]